MPFDYKKEYKNFYLPKDKPSIVNVPKMNFIAVRGKGDPMIKKVIILSLPSFYIVLPILLK